MEIYVVRGCEGVVLLGFLSGNCRETGARGRGGEIVAAVLQQPRRISQRKYDL